jgi:hypothetical protein
MHGTKQNVANSKKLRSRVTNGRGLFPRKLDGQTIDARTVWSRRVRDLIAAYSSDAGGPDELSEGMKAIIRRIALLQAQLERMESKWTIDDGEATPAEIDQYQRVSNTMRRLIESAGLKTRAAKNVTPDLQSHIAQRYGGRRNGRETIEHEA